MRILKVVFITAALVLNFLISNLYAEGKRTSGFASVDVISNYIWRGQKLSNSWVIQPSVGITYGSFGANIWANYDSDSQIDEGDKHGEFSETDLTLNYNFFIDRWNFSFGYIYYALNEANDTQEVYISASYSTLLNPTITVYYDYDEGYGAFIVASVGHSIDVYKESSLKLSASASYNINNKVMGFDENGDEFSNFYNAELSAGLNISLTKSISLTPKIAYSFPLSDDAKYAIERISNDGQQDILYGGINLTINF
jgi:hypothetical protein